MPGEAGVCRQKNARFCVQVFTHIAYIMIFCYKNMYKKHKDIDLVIKETKITFESFLWYYLCWTNISTTSLMDSFEIGFKGLEFLNRAWLGQKY